MIKTSRKNICRGRALGIAFGITMLFLLLVGDAGAVTPVSSCGTINSPGIYVLNTNLVSSTTCISITSSNVILDGAGYSITGTGVSDTYGVYVYNSSITLQKVTVKNLIVPNWHVGIYYKNTQKGTITNNNADSNIVGIQLSSSNNNTLTGNTANLTPFGGYGIGLSSSNFNTLTNNIANQNGGTGIVLDISSGNILMNNIASSNGDMGIWFVGSSNNNILFKNTFNQNGFCCGGGRSGILISTSSNNMLGGNTVNSNFDKGIYLYSSSNNTLLGNTANSNTERGIYLYSSSSNTLFGNNASNNNNGVFLDSSSNNNKLGGNTVNSNFDKGIYLYSSSNNTLLGNNASNDNNGIVLAGSSNTLNGNIVSLNNNNGIYMYSEGSNIIYNNYFKNTNNYYFGDTIYNTWNTTKTSGVNIVGGPYLGGNFWANPSGTGFSQTCSDSNKDRICNSRYVLDSNNTDYLPLTYSIDASEHIFQKRLQSLQTMSNILDLLNPLQTQSKYIQTMSNILKNISDAYFA